MNRSFRAEESLPSQIQAAAMRQRQQLTASMRKEKEDELALFLEMKKREKERNDLLRLNDSHQRDFGAPLGAKPGTSPIFDISSGMVGKPMWKSGMDEFLNSENDKNDYDW